MIFSNATSAKQLPKKGEFDVSTKIEQDLNLVIRSNQPILSLRLHNKAVRADLPVLIDVLIKTTEGRWSPHEILKTCHIYSELLKKVTKIENLMKETAVI